MYQKVFLIGYLGGDPQMRYTPEGTPVTSFSVATSRKWTDAQGQQQERTVWFRVSAWRKLAEVCNQYLKKGAPVFVEGELAEPKPYQDRQGQWRAPLDVTALNVKFLGKGETSAVAGAVETEGSEEIPF